MSAKKRIFISSVQKELAAERRALKDYIQGDPFLGRFFEVFLFEDLPASGRRANAVYLKEVDRCDVYLGLFGNEYGYEDAEGLSPTEREFEHATAAGKERLLFIKGKDEAARYPKMQALVREAGNQVIRRRFASIPELNALVYSSLVEYLVVMSKIAAAVGTRAESNQAPVTYELPRPAVAEAIVNAVAHRDYASNASVQVMLFADRLEVWNPGRLPPALTPEALRSPHASIPHNPLIAEPLFLTRYVEKAGTGILDMIRLCKAAGALAPQFRQDGGQFVQTLWRPVTTGTAQVTAQVTAQATAQATAQVGTKSAPSRHQVEILEKCRQETGLVDLMAIAERTDRTKFRHQVLTPLLAEGLIEMTIPDKPRSSIQKYRLTVKGHAWLKAGGKRDTRI